MSTSTLIFIALALGAIAVLPIWKYSRIWGGGYTPPTFVGLMLAAHLYTVLFSK